MPAWIEMPAEDGEYGGTVTYNDGSTRSLMSAIRVNHVNMEFFRTSPITGLPIYNVE
jgi:hypothetical protein